MSDMLTTELADLPPDHPCAGYESEIDELRDSGKFFHQRGWSVGTSSNYSVVLNNDPLDLIVTASGKDKGRLDRTDFVRLGPGGMPTSTGQPKSSAETMLHVVLADIGHVGCILHTHSIWGTLLSDYFYDEGGFAIEGYEMLKGLEEFVPTNGDNGCPFLRTRKTFPVLPNKSKPSWRIRLTL